MTISAETDRLILREFVATDKAGMFELDSDPEVHRYLGKQPVKHIEEIEKVIQFIRQQYIEFGIARWAVIEKSTGDFVGWSGLKFMTQEVNNHVNYYDLGYRFIKRYWGKGYATETAKASIDYGFTTLQANDIYAIADVGNAGSNHVLQKCGLTFINTFDYDNEPHHFYKITKAGWQSKQKPKG